MRFETLTDQVYHQNNQRADVKKIANAVLERQSQTRTPLTLRYWLSWWSIAVRNGKSRPRALAE